MSIPVITDLILNPRVSLVQVGTVFEDGGVVTDRIHPLPDSAAWFDPGCLNNFTHLVETQSDDAEMCYDDDDNLIVDVREYVTSDGFSWDLYKTNTLVTQLSWGLAGPIVSGETQLAFSKPVREIEAWLKFEGRNALDKTQFVTLNVYGRFKLPSPTAHQNGRQVKPTLEFKRRGSAPSPIRFGPAPAE